MSENNGHGGNGHSGNGAGGLGGNFHNPGEGTARDTRLLEKALRQRWPVPDEAKAEVVRFFRDVVSDEEAGDRERISAGRGIMYADRLNQMDEHLETKLNRVIQHEHTIKVTELTDGQLGAIIDGRFEEVGGEGTSLPPAGPPESS